MTTTKSPGGFFCRHCGGILITISDAAQMLLVKGHKRLHASVRCNRCGHSWWSRHSVALKMSRVADAAASGGGEDGG